MRAIDKKVVSLFLLFFFIITLFPSTVLANDGNSSEVISSNEEKTCSLKTTLTSIKPTDSEPGKVRIKVELLSTTDDIYQIFVHINSSLNSSVFRFSSTNTKVGLFASNTWSDQDKLNMLENGLISISEGKFLTLGATSIGFAQDGGLDIGKTGTLFTATLPVNPEYAGDWQSGLENILTVSYDIYSNGVFSGTINSESFSFPPAGMEDSHDSGSGVSTSTITGSLISDNPEPYNCGDTVKVTAMLTPDAAAKLSSGSLKFGYDTDKLEFIAAEVNPALTNGRATLFDNTPGTCVASFTSEGDAMDVTTDGLVLADFSFEAIKDGTAEFPVLEAVAADEKATAYTTQTGDSLSVIIQALPEVTTVDYGSDYKMVKYVADALPEEGNAYFIGDTALTCVPAYATGDNDGKYVFVMLSKDEPVDQTVTTKAGSYGTVTATGDANGDTRTNIIDAQVVYYMTTSKITSSDSGYDWLNSDVNGSGTLDALDAHAIQYFVHYGKFGQFSS